MACTEYAVNIMIKELFDRFEVIGGDGNVAGRKGFTIESRSFLAVLGIAKVCETAPKIVSF